MRRLLIAAVLIIGGMIGVSLAESGGPAAAGGVSQCQYFLSVNQQPPYLTGQTVTFRLDTVVVSGQCRWSGSTQLLVSVTCTDGSVTTKDIGDVFTLPDAPSTCGAIVRAVRYRGSFLVMDLTITALDTPLLVE